jgi:MoaA/NifB/PqqE/SkfB family radical SAM enzyme
MTVYCTAPWNGVTVREDGHVRTCCAGAISLGNLNDHTMDQILASPKLKKIKQDMLSNKPNLQNCTSCIKLEKQSGIATLRQHYNNFYSVNDHNEFKLKNLDIRWNNACNLGCMYCTPTFSSTWQDRLGSTRNITVKNYQDDLLNWISDHADQLEEIMLVGGEPMLMKQNYALLNRLPNQCKVSIITNLSYDLPNLPCIQTLLDRPKDHTIWNISLENTGTQFEYVRAGSKWSQVNQNLEYLVIHWPNQLSINFVYSMFSAFDIVQTVQELHRIGIKKINFFPIDNNLTVDVFKMPMSVRHAAADNLEAAMNWHFENLHPEDRKLYPLQGADNMLTLLRQSTDPACVTLNSFLDKLKWYDQYSKHKFEDLWPNVIDLVKKYL